MSASRPAVFLDRDGTLLTERGYLSNPQNIRFYPSVVPALKQLQKKGFDLIVITNQSGVGRGYFSLSTLSKINQRFTSLLRMKGVRINDIYFCPHAPDDGCRCRKPKPFLLQQAAKRRKISLASSFVVGDQMTDINMAVAAGVKPILVLTGSGRAQRKKAILAGAKITRNVSSAVTWILSQRRYEKR